ncbi:hypothetical protein BKA80DRAFT_272455 [Phyllosticta citrichinensis]
MTSGTKRESATYIPIWLRRCVNLLTKEGGHPQAGLLIALCVQRAASRPAPLHNALSHIAQLARRRKVDHHSTKRNVDCLTRARRSPKACADNGTDRQGDGLLDAFVASSAQ